MFTRRYTNFWDGLFRPSKMHLLGSGEVKTLTNLVSNGDFSKGTAGWNGINGSVSVANNTGSSTLSGATVTGGFQKAPSATPIIGHRYGLTVRMRVTNANCLLLRFYLGGVTGNAVQTNPAINQWYPKTFVITADNATQSIYLYHTYESAAIASGKVMEAQYVSVVDLTAAFGAGNEPALTDYENWIATQSNSWFDTTAQYLANTNQWF